MKKSTFLSLILSLVLINSSCINLSAIREFSDSATEAGKRFPELANDLTASCIRQHTYQKITETQFNPEKMILVAHPEKDSQEMKDAKAQCQNYADQQDRLIEANKVLVNYMKTMGDLAADNLTSYDTSLDTLGKSFTGANIFNDAEVKAVKGISSLIIKAATEVYGRKKLKDVIENNNEDVKTLTKALRDIVIENYERQLQLERDQTRSYYITSIKEYNSYMNTLAKNTGEQSVQDPLPIIEVKSQWDQKELEIDQKISAAEAYGEMLNSFSKGHQKLFEGRNKLSSKEVLETALQYAKSIESSVEDFRKVF